MADNYNEWIAQDFGGNTESYGEGYSRWVPGQTFYKDPNTGNYYNVPYAPRGYWAHPDEPLQLDWGKAELAFNDEILSDPYVQSFELFKDPLKAKEFVNLKQSNPTEFYGQAATRLVQDLSSSWKNNAYDQFTRKSEELLEEVKKYNPAAYYQAQISNLGQRIGWNYGENRPDVAQVWTDRLKEIIPEALKAGITVDQINSSVDYNANQASQENQRRINDQKGNFWTDNLMGALKIGAFALGATGLDAALGAGLSQLGSASQAAAITPDAYMASAGLTPGVFEGAAFTIPQTLGAAVSYASPADYMTQAGLEAGNFSGAEFIPEIAAPTYTSPNDYMSQAGLETGNFTGPAFTSPSANPLTDYMNQAGLETGTFEGPAFQMPASVTPSEVLSAANKARQAVGVGSSIAKLLGGGTGGTGGIDASKLAGLLRPTNTFNPINLQQIQPKNPFFGSNQGTLGGEDIYDVSGVNMANALRNR